MYLKENEKVKLIEKLEKIYTNIYMNININNFKGFLQEGFEINCTCVTLFHGRQNAEELFEVLSSYGNIYRFDSTTETNDIVKIRNSDELFEPEEVFEFNFTQFFITEEISGDKYILINGIGVDF